MEKICPLCGSQDNSLCHKDKKREYYNCFNCSLVFVPGEYYISGEKEKERYDLHENDPSDPGYRKYMSRFTTPLLKRIQPGEKGLDFGCGPGPVLHEMLSENPIANYDLFYCYKPELLKETYNFVTVTEVIEHLHTPLAVMKELYSLLVPGGLLGIMTQMVPEKNFKGWYYIQDMTHVCFFTAETFIWLAKELGAELEIAAKEVIFLKKP